MEFKRRRLFFLALIFLLGASIQPQEQSLILVIDGPDPGNDYTSMEAIHLGEVDCWGSPSAGGDLVGIYGKPVGASSIYDKACRGVLYEFLSATGGNNEFSHPTSILAVYVVSSLKYELSVMAQVNGDASVAVDQLFYKEDSQTEYIPFTNHPQTLVSSGTPGASYFFYDFGLQVEFGDKPGHYFWNLTYTLTSY
jgi:hypothetical protein